MHGIEGKRARDVVQLGPRAPSPARPAAITPQPKVKASPSEAAKHAALALVAPKAQAALAIYSDPAFTKLDPKVAAALRANLKLAPAAEGDALELLQAPGFTALGATEQRAALEHPRPDRIAHLLQVVTNPLWTALEGDRQAFFAAPAKVQDAVLTQFEAQPTMETGRVLLRLMGARWLQKMKPADQLRAVKVFAFCAAQETGATFEDVGISQKKLIQGALEELLKDKGYTLAFEDLPYGAHETVAGESIRPGTVILNRRVFEADDLPVGGGPEGLLEEHFALATLVHEVNHLHNTEPAPGTAAAFQDEYRAWFAGFVALMGRLPNRIEGLGRVRDLLTQPAYADLAEALDQKPAEAQQILEFLQAFGPVKSRADVLKLDITDVVSLAPLPSPLGVF